MKKIIVFCLLSLLLNVTAYCGQLSKVELTDGSVVNGEVVSYLNGIYTINTSTLGEVKIKGDRVSKIESVNNALPYTSITPITQTDNPVAAQVSSYGQTLMKNPENMAVVKGLTNDAALQGMANDPELQAAAKAGDIQALLNNPKFMNIVNSPEVQEAIKKIKQ